MKKFEIIAEGINFTAGNIGELDSIKEYSYLHPQLNKSIDGKIFIGKKVKSTATEISFQVLPPKVEIPFYHKHNKNEEIYIIVKGSGEFQVDNISFHVREGSIIRVAPKGKRTWKNSSDEPMIFIVIQAKVDSLEDYETQDGYGLRGSVVW